MPQFISIVSDRAIGLALAVMLSALAAFLPTTATAQEFDRLQRMLNELGYDAGPVDGKFGGKSLRALQTFQRDHALPVTSEPDSHTTSILRYVYERQRDPVASRNGNVARKPTDGEAVDPSSENPANADNLAALLDPPSGIERLAFDRLDGLPMFKFGDNDERLFPLIKIGAIPQFLETNECRLIPLLFSEAVQKEFLQTGSCHGPVALWNGADEFERAETRERFHDAYGAAIRSVAPTLPVTVTFVDDVRLGAFEAQSQGFPLSGGFRFGEGIGTGIDIEAASDINPDDGGSDEAVSVSAQFTWPRPFLPMAESEARQFIKKVNSWPYSEYGLAAQTGQRVVRRATVLRFVALDPQAMRLDVELVRMSLYDLDLTHRLYEFPLTTNVLPFAGAAIPERLNVPAPALMDEAYFAMQAIAYGGDQVASETWGRLKDLIKRRDWQYYFGDHEPIAFAGSDARRPFFPRGNRDVLDASDDAFRQWVKAYIAGLPVDLEYEDHADYSSPKPGSRHVFPASIGKFGASGVLADALAQLGVQADQVSVISAFDQTFAFVLPNTHELYQIEVPGDVLSAHVGKGLKRKLHVRTGKTELVALQDGTIVPVMYVEPIALSVETQDVEVARRTLEDVPRLDSSFTVVEPPEEKPATGDAIPLTNGSVDMLVAAAQGDSLPADIIAGLVIRRWHMEKAGETFGGRFFVPGKRKPSPDEAAAIGRDFLEWSRARIPAFPVRISVAAEFDLKGDAAQASWSVVACLKDGLKQEDLIRIAANKRALIADEQKRQAAESGEAGYTWTPENSVRQLARSLEPRATEFMRELTEPCYDDSDPVTSLPLFLAMLSGLPLPTEDVGPAPARAEITLEITGINIVDRRPSYLDLIPEPMRSHLADTGVTAPAGRFAVAEARLAEVLYRNADGSEATAEDNPEISLAALAAQFEAGSAKLLRKDADAGEPYGFDMIGLKLGMSFAEAEKIIRAHMNVGRVLDGSRIAGEVAPANAGRLFVSADGRELIALIDEPPTAEGRIMAAWRRLYVEPGAMEESSLIESLRQKYGTPSARTIAAGVRNFWSEPSGNDCQAAFQHGGMRPALGSTWLDDGKPAQWQLPNGLPVPDAMLPMPMTDPLEPNNRGYAKCGPVFTAEFVFDASRAKKAGYPNQDLDWIEQIISDVGSYMKAYEASRAIADEKNGTASGGNVKL